MKSQKTYMIQLYRQRPGDVDVPDMPTFQEDLATAEQATSDRLLAAFNDKERPAHERPHHAHLVDADGSIVRRLMVNGFRKVERCWESG